MVALHLFINQVSINILELKDDFISLSLWFIRLIFSDWVFFCVFHFIINLDIVGSLEWQGVLTFVMVNDIRFLLIDTLISESQITLITSWEKLLVHHLLDICIHKVLVVEHIFWEKEFFPFVIQWVLNQIKNLVIKSKAWRKVILAKLCWHETLSSLLYVKQKESFSYFNCFESCIDEQYPVYCTQIYDKHDFHIVSF